MTHLWQPNDRTSEIRFKNGRLKKKKQIKINVTVVNLNGESSRERVNDRKVNLPRSSSRSPLELFRPGKSSRRHLTLICIKTMPGAERKIKKIERGRN